jgi:REP element-mobilizing transposase RayT
MHQRRLPHWRQEGATYFVTFRLADSLPQTKLNELEFLKTEWEQKYPPPQTSAVFELLTREVYEQVERWLDQGMGSCVLKEPCFAKIVASSMHHFDDDRYELDAYAVLPNHVHAILRPLKPLAHPLEAILASWKKYTSRLMNQELNRRGDLWQEECYDRIVRDEEHLWSAIQYVRSNPERANLPPGSCPLWVRPQWVELGWKFETPEVRRTALQSRLSRDK